MAEWRVSCYGAGDRKFHGPAVHPSGMAVGILFQWAALETEKETPLLEPWQDSAVPPVQVPCFLSKDTKGGRFTWKRKGAGTKVTASWIIPEGKRKKQVFSFPGWNKLVPFLCPPCSVNNSPSCPCTRVCSACFLSLAFLPPWHSFSLGCPSCPKPCPSLSLNKQCYP